MRDLSVTFTSRFICEIHIVACGMCNGILYANMSAMMRAIAGVYSIRRWRGVANREACLYRTHVHDAETKQIAEVSHTRVMLLT